MRRPHAGASSCLAKLRLPPGGGKTATIIVRHLTISMLPKCWPVIARMLSVRAVFPLPGDGRGLGPGRAAFGACILSARGRTQNQGETQVIETILVAVDASAQQTAILDQAAELAIASGARVHVVSVADALSKGKFSMYNVSGELIELLTREVDEVLNRACTQLSDQGVSCRTHALVGPVAQRIVDLAVELHANLIIIGHRRLAWLQRLVENSVGSDLLASAPCNVLIVMEGTPDA
jgi:nucleotide-binding universal stress UspA family protein